MAGGRRRPQPPGRETTPQISSAARGRGRRGGGAAAAGGTRAWDAGACLWAWAWAWPRGGAARGASGARRAGGCGGGGGGGGGGGVHLRGGCCARYWDRCLRRRRGGLRPARASARCGLVMATKQRPYHLVVLGASGFTGQFVAEEVAREQVATDQSPRLPWAVAGRSAEKLKRVLERAALKLGRPTLSSEVGIIICDVTNPASLDEMAKQASVVLNCVGPYRFYGEPVVKACIENGTSCIDICGEPQVRRMERRKWN
ncbi:saccharopine dehydrogenase-like oxidoreductase [Hyaena hyaena]|uniref:saccharopine dehydrogenase-like oxidoreductase n=1 Tax=Hyaena hyaena TaxID=95912 RepID=UPI0019234908|nr:saccharopine dehydrogenase-like oxidoreductase [Hyaena hyaena]